MTKVIPRQSGDAFRLNRGDLLKVIDPEGRQVSDMVLFSAEDHREYLSSGKTLDFESSMLLTKGNFLWSNRSRKMMEIVEDTNGRNDFLLAPCSQETFEILYGHEGYHPSCLQNLQENLAPFGISKDEIPTAFNIFMNVQFDLSGKIKVFPPTSQAGDYVIFRALMDLTVGLTACSAEDSNGGSFKPIHYELIQRDD